MRMRRRNEEEEEEEEEALSGSALCSLSLLFSVVPFLVFAFCS